MQVTRSLQSLISRKAKIGSLGAIDFLISRARQLEKHPNNRSAITNGGFKPSNTFLSTPIELDSDYVKTYSRNPSSLPPEFKIPPPKGMANDYSHLLEMRGPSGEEPPVSICILTYNRSQYLRRTLAALCKQTYNLCLIEIIVSDDGSSGGETLEACRDFSSRLNIKYTWQPDQGFRAAKARNNAISLASNDVIILLDVDMLPCRSLVSSYAGYSKILNQSALIGPRSYVEASHLSENDILNAANYESLLIETNTHNPVADRKLNGKSIDWRIPIFEETSNLITEKLPFRVFASGNVCFSKKEFELIGEFDERFQSWGYEDTELAFRFYNNGKYFIPVLSALAYHQEPPDGKNETDREMGKIESGKLFGSLCPFYRKLSPLPSGNYEVPIVSIYIPAYNCSETICDAVDSALRQTYKDLEVCICDDGSTDNTLDLLSKYYSSNPRVRYKRQNNKGIGAASNTAVRMCRGLFIGQLDSDDILADDAVELCVDYLEKDEKLGLVYTSYFNWHQDTDELTEGYNYPCFSREKAITAMIFHHFRLFRKQYWSRTEGFNESIKNAVDYDIYLKLMEKAEVFHVNRRAYVRRLHGSNTSLMHYPEQVINTATVVNMYLARQGINMNAALVSSESPLLRFIER